MPGVERRVEIHERVQLTEGFFGKRCIGIGAVEVPAEAEAHLHFPLAGGFHTAHRIQSWGRRKFDAKTGLQALEDGVLQFRRDTNRADSLHIAVPANGQQPGVRPADHAPHQCQVGDRLHVAHAMSMVRDAHGLTENDVPGLGIQPGDGVDFGLRGARLVVDVRPV